MADKERWAPVVGWEVHTTTSRISAGRGGAIRSEFAWLNPACSAALHHRPQHFELNHQHFDRTWVQA